MTDTDPDDATADGDQLTASSPAEAPSEPESGTDAAPDESATTGVGSTTWTDELEAGAASFVELEAALADDGAAPDRARVVGAERVPAGDVPADYPRSVATEQALALRLAAGDPDDPVTAYFPWPPTGDDPLGRLLAALDVSPDSFADLNGRRLLVTVEDGSVLPVVPRTRPRGSESGLLGILAGQAVNLALLVGGPLLGLSGPAPLLTFLLVTLVVLPLSTFLDARHLESTTDWTQGPTFWALLHAVPGLNVLATAAYLRYRRAARPIDGTRSR